MNSPSTSPYSVRYIINDEITLSSPVVTTSSSRKVVDCDMGVAQDDKIEISPSHGLRFRTQDDEYLPTVISVPSPLRQASPSSTIIRPPLSPQSIQRRGRFIVWPAAAFSSDSATVRNASHDSYTKKKKKRSH